MLFSHLICALCKRAFISSSAGLGEHVEQRGIQDIQKLNPEDRAHVFALLAAFIQSQKLKKYLLIKQNRQCCS
jgi:hypothetical protein